VVDLGWAMDAKDLLALSEADVAALLGVSARMVRKYISKNDLPCDGSGRDRTFTWSRVLDWYLLYRFEIVAKGGRQRNILARKVRKLEEAAVSAAERECFEIAARRLARLNKRHEQEMNRLRANSGGSRSPHARVRRRVVA